MDLVKAYKRTNEETTNPIPIPRQRKIRKLRRLRKPVESVPPESSQKKAIFCLLFILIIVIPFFIILKKPHVIKELKNLALNQYQLYSHGQISYCTENFKYENITNELSSRVIGQEIALSEIKHSFQQHENITALAIVGTQGVGKTLTLNIIQNKFQWYSNVQQYLWSSIHSEQSQLKHLFDLMENLSTCGQNGIFIDNIPLKSIQIIKEFNGMLLHNCSKNNIKLIVIYVFHIDYDVERWGLPAIGIDNVKSINYRQLNSSDLRKCLSIESERLKVNLTPQQIDDISAHINVKRIGCKTVAAKVSRYFLNETDDL